MAIPRFNGASFSKDFDKVKVKNELLPALEEHGCLILENFVSIEDCDRIKEEILKIKSAPFAKHPTETYNRIQNRGFFYAVSPYTVLTGAKSPFQVDAVPRAFSHPVLDVLCQKYLGFGWFVETYIANHALEDLNPLTNWHVDHFGNLGRCVKTFLYLNDTDKDNGAFSFVPRSHNFMHWLSSASKVNQPKKELYEIDHIRSVAKRVLENAKGPDARNAQNLLEDIEAHIQSAFVSDDAYSVAGPKGSMLVFDPIGIHRGGVIRKGERLIVRRHARQLQIDNRADLKLFMKRSLLRFRYGLAGEPIAAHV